MSGAQLSAYVLAMAPTVLVVLVGILINNSRLNDMNGRFKDMDSRFADMNSRLNDMNSRIGDMSSRIGELRSHMDARFDAVDQRFDDMKETWRSELHRVEEVLGARLRHLEAR